MDKSIVFVPTLARFVESGWDKYFQKGDVCPNFFSFIVFYSLKMNEGWNVFAF